MPNSHDASRRTLDHARAQCQAARDRLIAAPLNSGLWYDARASLGFWEARAALLAANATGGRRSA